VRALQQAITAKAAHLRAGARVYISSRKQQACRAAEESLSQFGTVSAIACDVSSEQQCRGLIDTLIASVNGEGLTAAAFTAPPDAPRRASVHEFPSH